MVFEAVLRSRGQILLSVLAVTAEPAKFTCTFRAVTAAVRSSDKKLALSNLGDSKKIESLICVTALCLYNLHFHSSVSYQWELVAEKFTLCPS